MAKGFSKNNPLDKLSGTSALKNTEIQKPPLETINPKSQDAVSGQVNPPPPKRKVGRPKTKDVKHTCKNINVAIPITLLNQWEDIKIVHGSNLTGYITKLIEKDMKANYKHYKDIADNLKNI